MTVVRARRREEKRTPRVGVAMGSRLLLLSLLAGPVLGAPQSLLDLVVRQTADTSLLMREETARALEGLAPAQPVEEVSRAHLSVWLDEEGLALGRTAEGGWVVYDPVVETEGRDPVRTWRILPPLPTPGLHGGDASSWKLATTTRN